MRLDLASAAEMDRQRFIREDPLALRQVTTSFLLASRRLRASSDSPERRLEPRRSASASACCSPALFMSLLWTLAMDSWIGNSGTMTGSPYWKGPISGPSTMEPFLTTWTLRSWMFLSYPFDSSSQDWGPS